MEKIVSMGDNVIFPLMKCVFNMDDPSFMPSIDPNSTWLSISIYFKYLHFYQ
jgi:hypothetical protein